MELVGLLTLGRGDPDPVRLERRELAGVHVGQGTEYRLDDFGPDRIPDSSPGGPAPCSGMGEGYGGADMTGRWFCLIARPGFGTWAADLGTGCDDPARLSISLVPTAVTAMSASVACT